MGSESKAEQFIEQLNANNAKKVALVIVLAFICYHGLIHLKYGSDSCRLLLTKGRFKGNKEWQPYGCMIHHYDTMDTRRCLRYLAFWGHQNHFVFIGDSRIRFMYQGFVNYLKPEDPASSNDKLENGTSEDLNSDLEYVDYRLRLRVNYIFADNLGKMIRQFKDWQKDPDPPTAIIASCTYKEFFQGNLTDSVLKDFSFNLTKLVKPIDDLISRKSKILWKFQDPINDDYFQKQMEKEQEGLVTEPIINKDHLLWRNVKNDDINRINRITNDILGYSDGNVWSSGKLIAFGLLDEMKDGFKLGPLAMKHNLQILLNMYCNDNMNYNDGTCCSSNEPYTILQIVTYAIFGVCFALSVAISVRRWCHRLRGLPVQYVPLTQLQDDNNADDMDNAVFNAESPPPTEYQAPIFALTTLALIMAYFYLCDRTNFFMKENKYYSEFSFWIPVGYIFVLGMFFTEDSRFTKVLHRDQMDELKGWMQLVILIYHMTGAEHIVPIYMHMKLLISGFLFLSGYSHFSYMWKTGNNGLVRFFQVLFQMNFMTIVLCLCMNRPYQFYYFVPLLSFWFCVIYFVLWIPPQITVLNCEQNPPYQYLYLALKIICLLGTITVFYMSEVFFERIFVTRPWKAIFVTTDDDIHEWWYRWKLDRYSISFGLIFAILVHLSRQKFNIFDDNNHANLFSRRVALFATLAGVLGIGFYLVFSIFCQNKQNCEEIHSYIAFIPVVGFLVLRNISGYLRTRYSSFFAWFGQISLELFVCQYHIWLAADRHGVLVLVPGFPNLNLLITSFIFVCVSHEVHRLTLILQPVLVPNDWKLVLRNFVIFLIVLVPIAKYDGMF